MPTPDGRPVAFASGPNADRVLLVGAGIAVGYGVASSDLALGGYLARALSAITGRGTSVDTIARRGLRLRDAPTVLSGLDLERFDATVLTLGLDEALHLVARAQFRSHLTAFLDWVDLNAPVRFGVVLVGVPDLTTILNLPAALRAPVRRRCAQLDSELKRLCGNHPQATYVPFTPKAANLVRDGDKRLYLAWAALIAPTIARVLDARAADPREPATIEELRRQLALDDLHILDTVGESRFDRIVADARRLFGVKGASITFIDRDRQWSKACLGMDPFDSPRGSALGDATIQNGKLLVVEDASLDERFLGHPWVAGRSAIRFFAGFPIEAANGERVGALCLSDPAPRGFTAADDSLLGMLAQQVQNELWGTPKPAVA